MKNNHNNNLKKKQDENGKILAERPPQKIMKLLTLELPKGEFDVETPDLSDKMLKV